MKKYFVLLFFLALNSFAQSTTQSSIRWAADTESGAPFAMVNPQDPSKIIGFEVEIMEEIGKDLGIKLEFVQNSWDGLIPGLKSNNYDLAINGIEITPDREQEINFTRPYYITSLQLVVKKNQYDITTLEDCKNKKVGTLKFSLAHRMLESKGNIDILTYESEVAAYSDLKTGRSEAVFLDSPIAIYYAKPDPELKFTGGPIGQMLYGVAIKKENTELLNKVNHSLKKMIDNGKLREILERWSLWNTSMASYLNDDSPSRIPPVEYQKFLDQHSGLKTWKTRIKEYSSFIPALMKGAFMTLKVSIIGMLIAVALGFTLALLKIFGPKPLSWLATLYIEVVRGTPLLIQLFFIFYGLPHLGINLSPFIAAILGLGFNYAAYEAENYRAGLLSVPKAQMEAALALGMRRREALRYIIIPQAFKISLPPMTNDFISLLKDSSLVSVITMVELTKVYGQLASTYYDYFGTGVLVALIYLVLGLPFIRIARHFENKLNVELKQKKIG
ncbi:MAG: ABC transporter substrate-binding protein/permease [Bacteriovoracaceae bacterium]